MMIATAAGETFGIGVILSAFFFGFRHGIDWDHIAAITDIAGSQDDRRSAMFFGTLYALGHALVVFLIGTAAILLGERLPESVDNVMERIVGVTLILLGVFVFVSLARHGREFRLRSRWMLIFSGVRNVYRRVSGAREDAHDREPVHTHAAVDGEDEPGSAALAVAEDIPVSDWHHGHHGRPGHHHHKHPEPDDDAFMNYGRGTAFVVGMIHGIGAETPTQIVIFLAAAGAGGKAVGEAVLAAFIVGLLTSNSLITFGSAVGFLKASENWKIYVSIAVITAVFSLVIGTLFLFGNGAVLPAIFGG
jgi:ABC-type nickel/cobalt efflux system permease component RcnA